ncbi:MAG: hypothetical protein M3Q40_05730 [Pseudomonadota bacterium]|nr:hypothetical protein [Pseudomonadota bacterium]
MFPIRSIPRAAITAVVLASVISASGCSWFRKSDKLYAQSPESRPLEVPPDLDQPRTDAAIPAVGGSATASAASGAQATTARSAAVQGVGFTAPGSRDEVFEQVGKALEVIEGVTIASRAQLLGAYDVSYQGSNFLVRISEGQGGAYVSAVDPRGVAASGAAPMQLMEALKAALAGS